MQVHETKTTNATRKGGTHRLVYRSRTKGTKGVEPCVFVLYFYGERRCTSFIDDDKGTWKPRFNAAETAPETRLYFVPSISPLSLTAPGEKEADNVTSHWSQFGEKFPMKFILCRDNPFSYNDRIYRQDRVAIHYIYIYIQRESFNN